MLILIKQNIQQNLLLFLSITFIILLANHFIKPNKSTAQGLLTIYQFSIVRRSAQTAHNIITRQSNIWFFWFRYETLNAEEVEAILENPTSYTIRVSSPSSSKSSKASREENGAAKPAVNSPTQPTLSGRADASHSGTPAAPIEPAGTAANKWACEPASPSLSMSLSATLCIRIRFTTV